MKARVCALPLKSLVTGTIDLGAVARLAAPRHRPGVSEAAAILAGVHPAWAALFGKRTRRRIPSGMTADQLESAITMGLIREVATPPTAYARLYAVPKSDGRTSRPIYDARFQNGWVNWSVVGTKLRLLRPLSHVRVGLAVGCRDPLLVEVDAKSYFPSFRWDDRLARHHGVYAGGRHFVHRVPAQGCSLMPLVAQTVSAALADGPTLSAPDVAWVRSGTSIVYDNWLLSGERQSVRRRFERLCARLAAVGVVIGDIKGPATSLESCGFRFDVGGARRWTLKPDWCERALPLLTARPRGLLDRQRQAGVALWAIRALLLPVAMVHHLIRCLERDDGIVAVREAELRAVAELVRDPPWRALKDPSATGDRAALNGACVVYSDASVYGVGAVEIGRGYMSHLWTETLDGTEQQHLEAVAALMALRWSRPSAHTLLVVDNTGVAGWLLSGNPTSPRSVAVLLDIAALLEERRTTLWVSVVPTTEMLADGPSRGGSARVPPSCDRAVLQTALECEWSAATYAVGRLSRDCFPL